MLFKKAIQTVRHRRASASHEIAPNRKEPNEDT